MRNSKVRSIAGIIFLLVCMGTGVWGFDLSVVVGGGFGLGMDREVFGTEVHTGGGEYDQYSNYFVGMGTGARGLGGIELGFGENFSLAFTGGYAASTMLHLEHSDAAGGHDVYLTTEHVPFHLTLRGRVPLGAVEFFFGSGLSMAPPPMGLVIDTAGDEEWILRTEYREAFGYHGVVGAEVHLGRLISIRLEFRGEQLTTRPRRATIESYTVAGADMLEAAYPDLHDREIIFVTDIAEYLNDPLDPTDPVQALAYNISFDNVSVFLGVVVHLIK